MFEKASRLKLRFETTKGSITVEDLWDLPLTSANGANLDNIAKSLSRALKETEDESFVTTPVAANAVLKFKFELIKYVIKVRLEEADAATQAKARKDEKANLLALIADKENEQLKNTPLEELKKRVAAL